MERKENALSTLVVNILSSGEYLDPKLIYLKLNKDFGYYTIISPMIIILTEY